MRFGFTEDQLMLRDTVREVLARECPPEVVRAAWEGSEKKAERPFRTLAENGLLGMVLTEAQGGLGMNEIDAALPLEEAGYAALPEPIVEVLAALPLIAEAAPEWAEKLAAGEARLALSLTPARLVPFASTADVFLRYDGERLFLAPREAVTLAAQVSVDRARSVATPSFSGEGVTLATGAEAAEATALVFDRAAFGASAFLAGLSRKMLELAVEYAKDRVQFGKPIGSQQAVKHRLADALIALEFSKPLAYRAAYSLATGDASRSLHVSLAKLRASEAARTVAKQALQVHGAIGYTIEHDLHLWMKRAWALSAAYGTEDFHRDRIGRAILPEETGR